MTNRYRLIEVVTRKNVREFLDFPSTLYRSDKYWIRPLDNHIEEIFNPKSNRYFEKGNAIRWLLKDSSNQVVGNIAAFYNEDTAAKNDQPTGGCGFFDCINDPSAAAVLFDAAKEWLQGHGMEAMDGPVNFGWRNQFWGCLSKGFSPPIYNMPYNHGYYNALFENYGFKNWFNQLTFHISLPRHPGDFDPAFHKKASRIRNDPGIRFGHHDKRNIEKSANDFMAVFNSAWAGFAGVKPMSLAETTALVRSMNAIIDPDLIIFVYYKNKPIGFYFMIPDLFQIIKKFNGRFTWMHKLRLLYELKVRKACTRSLALLGGAVPEFQGKGVLEGCLEYYFESEAANGVRYTDLELSWVGDFNPKMTRFLQWIGAKPIKNHITYRYLFDRSKEFKRSNLL